MAEATSDNRGPVIATITTNADGWFQAVSPQFLELIGRPVEALAGVNLVDLVHPMQTPAVRRLFLDAATSDVGADQQSLATTTRLFVAGDTWVSIVLVADRIVDERIRLSLHRVADAAPGDAQPPMPVAVRPNDPAKPESLPSADPMIGSSDLASVWRSTAATSPVTKAAAHGFPGEAAGDFPYEDSEAHMAYVAKMPPVNVPELRDAVRQNAGDDSTPMLEIDVDGRTTFVRGPWSELSTEEASGRCL